MTNGGHESDESPPATGPAKETPDEQSLPESGLPADPELVSQIERLKLEKLKTQLETEVEELKSNQEAAKEETKRKSRDAHRSWPTRAVRWPMRAVQWLVQPRGWKLASIVAAAAVPFSTGVYQWFEGMNQAEDRRRTARIAREEKLLSMAVDAENPLDERASVLRYLASRKGLGGARAVIMFGSSDDRPSVSLRAWADLELEIMKEARQAAQNVAEKARKDKMQTHRELDEARNRLRDAREGLRATRSVYENAKKPEAKEAARQEYLRFEMLVEGLSLKLLDLDAETSQLGKDVRDKELKLATLEKGRTTARLDAKKIRAAALRVERGIKLCEENRVYAARPEQLRQSTPAVREAFISRCKEATTEPEWNPRRAGGLLEWTVGIEDGGSTRQLTCGCGLREDNE